MKASATTDNQNELFVVVDKSDKIIGYRTRFECHHNKELIHRAAGVVILNNQGQILLQKRSKNKDTHPGLYTISASGHVNKGETYMQAAKRELKEELGVTITSPLRRKIKFLMKLESESEIDCLFLTKHEGPFFPNKEEIDELKFVTPDRIKQMLSLLTPFAVTNFKQLGIL